MITNNKLLNEINQSMLNNFRNKNIKYIDYVVIKEEVEKMVGGINKDEYFYLFLNVNDTPESISNNIFEKRLQIKEKELLTLDIKSTIKSERKRI